ncbi:Hypothetical Protein FCC1311_075932 [Hondaea fermentalgiana]|uniref:Uncharacterized protein n=1 Tax=Hondaea fermentalgiana TaxID=2315210 RepID=A0A2R5GM26_9STRA|nr:Hypothetical Protein FCC1311_075932 [Hondaea fermentalgiana]|eukprot:GBG31369.1 Hypothetical Protein FCC1311_075932 [Hondaea fermentalgiana]
MATNFDAGMRTTAMASSNSSQDCDGCKRSDQDSWDVAASQRVVPFTSATLAEDIPDSRVADASVEKSRKRDLSQALSEDLDSRTLSASGDAVTAHRIGGFNVGSLSAPAKHHTKLSRYDSDSDSDDDSAYNFSSDDDNGIESYKTAVEQDVLGHDAPVVDSVDLPVQDEQETLEAPIIQAPTVSVETGLEVPRVAESTHYNSYSQDIRGAVIDANYEMGSKYAIELAERVFDMPASTAYAIIHRAKVAGRDVAITDHRSVSNRTQLKRGGPLRMEHLFKMVPEMKSEFEKRSMCTETIRRHLTHYGIVYSYKTVKVEKSSVNTKAAMEKRLAFAKKLERLLKGGDKNFLIFVDELPFYVALHPSHGWAKVGERATIKTPPIGGLGHRCQGALAVNDEYGLLHADFFPAQKMPVLKRNKQETTAWKANYRHQEFRSFLNNLLGALLEGSAPTLQKDPYIEILRGMKVWIIMDNAPEHTTSDFKENDDLLKTLPNYEAFMKGITCDGKRKGEIHILRSAPNSPQLNLCENYNRMLRTWTNHKRNDPKIEARLLNAHVPHGQKTQHRLNVLERIVRMGAAAPVPAAPPLPFPVRKFHFETREELDKAIDDANLHYGTCLLDHWQFCVGGLLIGLPLSIRYKSQLYWAIGGISGTLLDYSTALGECKHYRHEAEHLTKMREKLDEQAKAEASAPSTA